MNEKNEPMWRRVLQDPSMPPPMRAQLTAMRTNGLKWKAEHPQAELYVEFPGESCQDKLIFVGAIDEVIEGNAMKVNAEAVEFFKALWPWHCYNTPTINMCRLVLEQVYDKSQEASR